MIELEGSRKRVYDFYLKTHPDTTEANKEALVEILNGMTDEEVRDEEYDMIVWEDDEE